MEIHYVNVNELGVTHQFGNVISQDNENYFLESKVNGRLKVPKFLVGSMYHYSVSGALNHELKTINSNIVELKEEINKFIGFNNVLVDLINDNWTIEKQ